MGFWRSKMNNWTSSWVLPPGFEAVRQELSSHLLLSKFQLMIKPWFIYILTGLECLRLGWLGLNTLPWFTKTARDSGEMAVPASGWSTTRCSGAESHFPSRESAPAAFWCTFPFLSDWHAPKTKSHTALSPTSDHCWPPWLGGSFLLHFAQWFAPKLEGFVIWLQDQIPTLHKQRCCNFA